MTDKDTQISTTQDKHDVVLIANAKKRPRTFGGLSKYVLGDVGQRLALMYRNNHKAYRAVDLHKSTFGLDMFRKQSGYLGKQVFGTKGMAVGLLAQKLIAKETLHEYSEQIYQKIASWAEYWAKTTLAKELRFANLSTLTPVERQKFIQDINNKNRLLASLGGVCGFVGLKGVVLDTAWLLLVSLKAVYELSLIYDQALLKQDGAVIAYGILSECELDELQYKQVLMTALALGEGVLSNAQTANLSDELKKFAKTYNYDGKYIDELTKFVNLEKVNSKWLRYLLPVGSAMVAVHYNNKLIEEIIGVAMATFEQNDDK